MNTLPPDVLAARLRAQAAGGYAAEAAVELLIAHRTWLTRDDFLAACVDVDDDIAWIDWHAVPRFLDRAPAAGSEARILALAAELNDIPTGRTLGDLLTSLDDRNARLVLDAIGHVVTRGGRR